jgi:hypothetical protein
MRKLSVPFLALLLLAFMSMNYAQEYTRKVVEVPEVKGKITIDGKMTESDWQNAAHADILTSSGSEGFFNKYYPYGDALTEPDYKEIYGRMLWSKDTLYLFYHVQQVKNDTLGLYFGADPKKPEQWAGDQMFVGISSRLGIDSTKGYNGTPYRAPDGPYYYFIYGDSVTLNGSNKVGVPPEWRFPGDTTSERTFYAKNICRYAVFIDTTTATWDVEMAIYQPDVAAQAKIGFNLGGNQGARKEQGSGDHTYSYYTWQPSTPNDPYKDPVGLGDPGNSDLVTSRYWALLHFVPAQNDTVYVRKVVDVPMADSGTVKIDGKMDETAWTKAAHADILTSSGSEGFFNKYYPYGDALTEPDYKEIYGRMLWSKDTLYLFYHVQQVKNDTLGLYFGADPKKPEQWAGDQMFVGISSRLGIDSTKGYNGTPYRAPDGPYYYFIYGDSVTLNGSNKVGVPPEWRFPGDTTSERTFYAKNICRYAVFIDTTTATWDVEMAIYQPDVAAQAKIGFNLGGNQGARKEQGSGDHTYSYYTWQPSTPNDPYKDPVGLGDPGNSDLVTSRYWALLNFVSKLSGVARDNSGNFIPSQFALTQNYPNPFNPSTTIRFEVPQLSNVTLKVYNIVGQVVATLVNDQTMSAGKYQVDWNASRLASGVYFYSLEAGSVHITKKLMLVK